MCVCAVIVWDTSLEPPRQVAVLDNFDGFREAGNGAGQEHSSGTMHSTAMLKVDELGQRLFSGTLNNTILMWDTLTNPPTPIATIAVQEGALFAWDGTRKQLFTGAEAGWASGGEGEKLEADEAMVGVWQL